MADLPKERITPDKPPFTAVGVDYFGPLEVKQGRSRVKRYGCIFTCLALRAVHIEIAHSLDTDSMINALRDLLVCVVVQKLSEVTAERISQVQKECYEKRLINGTNKGSKVSVRSRESSGYLTHQGRAISGECGSE